MIIAYVCCMKRAYIVAHLCALRFGIAVEGPVYHIS